MKTSKYIWSKISHIKCKHDQKRKISWRPGYLKIPLANKVPTYNPSRFLPVGHAEGKVYMKKPWATELKENICQKTAVVCAEILECTCQFGATHPL
jgi:hypothetical protein